MMNWFRSWAEGIVIAVIIATLIEMLLPNNTSKKYIKIVIGIFVVYTIISPVINKITDIDMNSSLDFNSVVETSSRGIDMDEINKKGTESIKNIYKRNLENDLKTKLEEKGFVAGEVNIQISDDESYNIEKIFVRVDEKVQTTEEDKQTYTIVDAIKYISIKISKDESVDNVVIDNNDKNNIKEFIKNTYDVAIDKININ